MTRNRISKNELNDDLRNEINNKADKNQETPMLFDLQAGWKYFDNSSYSKLKYYKDSFGIVHIIGSAERTDGSGFLLATLPEGYRPKESQQIIAFATNKGALTIPIFEDGRIGGDSSLANGVFLTINASILTF